MPTTRFALALTATLAATTVAVCAPLAAASPAQAAHDDSWSIWTDDGCGKADFVDYGPGLPGGGSNDDYIVVTDGCSDHHGVKVWAWLTRDGIQHYLGGAYDPYGNYYKGHPQMLWDPFKDYGNIVAGDEVGLKVCIVDGDNDRNPSHCQSYTAKSQDGFAAG